MARESASCLDRAPAPLRREWALARIDASVARSHDVVGVLHKLAVAVLPDANHWYPITVTRRWSRRGSSYAVVIGGLKSDEVRSVIEAWADGFGCDPIITCHVDGSMSKVVIILKTYFINFLEYKLQEKAHE